MLTASERVKYCIGKQMSSGYAREKKYAHKNNPPRKKIGGSVQAKSLRCIEDTEPENVSGGSALALHQRCANIKVPAPVRMRITTEAQLRKASKLLVQNKTR